MSPLVNSKDRSRFNFAKYNHAIKQYITTTERL